MNHVIDKNAQIPAYMQLYTCLVQDIVSGAYPYGSKLPSKRIIAADTGVSVITAAHAIAMLCDEGYTESRQRSGCFVIYRRSVFQSVPEIPDKEISDSRAQHHDIGEFPYSILSRTIRKVLLDYGDGILAKSPNHGCPELRNEICAYLARSRSITVRPGQVIIGSGAEYLYGLIAQLLGPERIFALEKPSYDKIRKVYEAMGITCDMLPLTRTGISTAALEKTEASVLHVTPFNSFPSGITAGINKKLEYLRWAKTRGGILIEDNYDSELTISRKAEDTLFSMDSGADVIYMNTFSKTIAPSVRIGYMILPEKLVDRFNDRLGFYSCTVPLFDQYVLAELLRSGHFERHINRIRRKRRRMQAVENTM